MTDEQATEISRSIERLADGIANGGVWHGPPGVGVGNVTEGLIHIGENIGRVADSISDLAESIRNMKEGE